MQVLVLEQEGESQVASHAATRLLLALLRKPPLILETLQLTVLEVLILLEHNWILLRDIFAHDLKIVTRLILVDRNVQIGVLDEARAGLGRLQVVNECVLGARQLDAVLQGLLLYFECDNVGHHGILQVLHVLLLRLAELLDETLERLTSFGLSRLGASTKEASYAVLEDLVDEVLVTKGLLLFGVLANDTHDLTEAVRIVDRHLDAGQRLRFVEEQVDMVTHLPLFLALQGHNRLLFSLKFLVISWGRRLSK